MIYREIFIFNYKFKFNASILIFNKKHIHTMFMYDHNNINKEIIIHVGKYFSAHAWFLHSLKALYSAWKVAPWKRNCWVFLEMNLNFIESYISNLKISRYIFTGKTSSYFFGKKWHFDFSSQIKTWKLKCFESIQLEGKISLFWRMEYFFSSFKVKTPLSEYFLLTVMTQNNFQKNHKSILWLEKCINIFLMM